MLAEKIRAGALAPVCASCPTSSGSSRDPAGARILSVRIGRHTRVRTHKRAHTYTTLNQQTIGPNVQDPRSP